jgi:subtilase family serine protease
VRIGPGRASKIVLLSAVFSVSALPFWAQEIAPPLISQPIDESKLTVLHGNTHPLARPAFDRGAVANNLPMNHMQLVLKRSPEQEAALEKLMAEQLNRSSSNYHKWLTPVQFGEQFGPSDQDILTITAWLRSHGFTIGNALKGKMTIAFSGTAGSVEQTFHTAIHNYVINGEEHWANATDPAIPTALTPAVVGIASLNNFFPKPQSLARPAKQIRKPLYTFPSGCSESTSSSNTNLCSYGVAPADFDKIYNVPSTLTGIGETIAIVSDSDINSTDVDQFRQIFGLPAKNFQQIETDPSNDPGIQSPNDSTSNGDEVEAVLDVEWSGAIAPAAQIDLVVTSDSESPTPGIDGSAQYIVNNQLAPIMSVSYGLCELDLGTAGNEFHNNLWQQAAAEGITVLVSTGDNGSAGCDIVEVNGPATQPATQGLEVNGLASTPYNVAVGGTDFDDPTPSTYWSISNNGTTQESALSYIPEMTWNDSCTSSIVIAAFDDSNAATACNDPTVQTFENQDGVYLVSPIGASGGMSNCTTNSTSTTVASPSTCSGGYAKPTWQTGPGVPNDGKRDVPDLSMFAADGLISGSFYIDCEADVNSGTDTSTACDLSTEDFVAVGGTSASAQAMAGIMALIEQKEGAAQGNINPTLYALGSQQSPSTCSSASPGASCVFNNVTVGTIEMPCATGSPNCTVTGSDRVGVLTGYNAGTGYNLATGLGSLNVTNLTNSWGPTFYISSTNPAVTVSSAGGSGNLTVTVNGVNGFAGNVTLACSGLPSGDTCTFNPSTPVSLSGTTTSASVTVTVQTASAELMPVHYPWGHGPSLLAISAIMTWLGCTGLVILLAASGDKRWIKTAFALAAFSAIIAVAGCGGGSSGSEGGGSSGGASTTDVTVTATSGSVASSMTFVLTVQ